MSIQERIQSFYMSHDISYGEVESFADDVEQIARADERERIGSMVEAMQEAGEADSAWLAFQAVLILLEGEQP